MKALAAQGMKIKGIAKKVKLSKNTVKKYLKIHDPPVFHGRDYVKKTDAYKDDIDWAVSWRIRRTADEI